MNDKGYFRLYEDRYRLLHEQGIEDWIADPDEMTRIINSVDDFLKYAKCIQEKTAMIEFGSGQGHLAEYLLGRGYRYLGVDVSASAIRQARKRTGEKGGNVFLTADVTNLKDIQDSTYDAAIDNQCLHMLVTDEHRKKYLAQVKRILKSGGKAFFRELTQPEEFKAKIASFEDFLEKSVGNNMKLHDYAAYTDGEQRQIKLPGIPARFNNENGYRRELEQAGFKVDRFIMERNHCIIYSQATPKVESL
ncbi:MAG: class I SAM-dependent methyltransferase [Dehalococcoidales bacterium]|jgi:SAM-dependent methyltransferase